MVSNDDLFVIGMGCIGVLLGIYWIYKKSKETVKPGPISNIVSPISINNNTPLQPFPIIIPPVTPNQPSVVPPSVVPPSVVPPSVVPPSVKSYTFLLMGQSNCANWGETPMISAKAQVFNNGKLYSNAADPLPGADGGKGSVWTRLVDSLDATKYKITLIPTAVGGTSINRWIPSANDLFKNVITQVNAYKTTGGKVTHVLWHQGESDIGMDPNDYKAKFIQIANALNTLTDNAKIYIAQATYCTNNFSDALRAIQAQLGQTYNAGPNTDTLGANMRYDNCHFSTSGLVQHAALWKAALGL